MLVLLSRPCGAVLLDWFVETDPLDIGTAAPAETPLKQRPLDLTSPTHLALLESQAVRVSLVQERGLRITRVGELVGRADSWRGSTTIAQRLGSTSPWVAAVRVESGRSPLLAKDDGGGGHLDGSTRAADVAFSRRLRRGLTLAGAALTSSDHFAGAVSGLSELIPPRPLTPVSLRYDARTYMFQVRQEKAGRAWQFSAERLDSSMPLRFGSGDTEVTFPLDVQGEGVRLRREEPLGGASVVVEAWRTTASGTTSITMPTFTTGRLDNRYRSNGVSVGVHVTGGREDDGLRVALVHRSLEFSVAGRASLPASLGGLPGDSLTFSVASRLRSNAAHVSGKWSVSPTICLRAGVQYLWASLSASADYRLLNLLRLRPPSAGSADVRIGDGRVLFAGLGASYCGGGVRLDAAVTRAFPRRSRDLDVLLPPGEEPGVAPRRTTGGLLYGLAVSRVW